MAQSSSLPLAAKVSALFYPTIYVSAAVLLVHEKVGGALRRLNSTPLRLVMFGLVAQAVAFGAWSYSLLKADYVVGTTLLDPLWVIGLAAIAVCAVGSDFDGHVKTPPSCYWPPGWRCRFLTT